MKLATTVKTILQHLTRDAPIAGPVIKGIEREIEKFFSPNNPVFLNQGAKGRKASRGPLVRAVQSRLNELDAELVVDEIYGPNTFAAVVLFQTKNGVTPDGICGTETLQLLFPPESVS
jgi:peptidoglycan hydrolase-like protein with peptidoglycan-binding domain